MKKINLLIIASVFSYTAQAQVDLKPKTQYLDINDISVPIFSGDLIMFGKDFLGNQYSSSKDSNKTIIFSSSLWISGRHNDSLHVSAQLYGQRGQEYHSGPLNQITGISDSVSQAAYNRTWKINRAEIEEFKNNYTNPNYSIPQIFLDWPAHGVNGMAANMAPFIDLNNDGRYNPKDGDYPKIMGDQMIYWIVNDRTAYNQDGTGRESGGKPLGLEIHCFAYAFQCNDSMSDSAIVLNRTTFYHFDIINKSTREYEDAHIGLFMDPDLGNFNDDYVGSYVLKNMGAAYNGDDNDEGPNGFGINPNRIAVGTPFLNKSMDHFMLFNNDYNPISGNPLIPLDYENYLECKWKNGNQVKWGDYNGTGGTMNTPWIYPLDTILPGQSLWSEGAVNNTPGDRRYVQSTKIGKWLPGEIHQLDYAIVFGELSNKDNLGISNMADMVQDWYDNNSFPSCLDQDQLLSNDDAEPTDQFKVYPNPNNGNFNIDIDPSFGNGTLTIINSKGQMVSSMLVKSGSVIIKQNQLPAGLYIVRVKKGNKVRQAKVLVR